MRTLYPSLLLVAAVSFGLGISLPLLRLDRLYFLTETPSLLDVIAGLWLEGSWALALVMGLFSIAFPLVKLYIAFQAGMAGSTIPGWVGVVGKWSLMDVVLVAIVIFAAKTSGLASAFTQPGLWFYGLSAVIAAIATTALRR